MYLTGYKGSSKAYLGINIIETYKQIESILDSQMRYIGGYRGSDNKVILEDIIASTATPKELFSSVASQEESIYKTTVHSKVKIGSKEDTKYLIATIYDLMCSLVEPMQGFTIERDYEDNYYLLICGQGKYIMNPNYSKELQMKSNKEYRELKKLQSKGDLTPKESRRLEELLEKVYR